MLKQYFKHTFLLYCITCIFLMAGIVAIVVSYMYKANYEHIGIAFILGILMAVAYIKRRTGDQKHDYVNNIDDIFTSYVIRKNMHVHLTFVFLYALILLIAVIIYNTTKEEYYLSTLYMLLLTSLALIVVIYIFVNSEPNVFSLIFGLILLPTIVSYSFLYLFPGYYGNDSPYHFQLLKTIINTGKVQSIAELYSIYPLYHIYLAVMLLITNTKVKLAFSILTTTYSLGILVFYSFLSKESNKQLILLSLLLFALSPYAILARFSYFPYYFGVTYMLIFFALYLEVTFRFNIKKAYLLILITIMLVIYHPLMPLIIVSYIIATMSIGILFNLFNMPNIKRQFLFLLVSIVTSIIQWMRPVFLKRTSTTDLFTILLLKIRTILLARDSMILDIKRATLAMKFSWSTILMYNLWLVLLLTFSVSGVIIGIWHYYKTDKLPNPLFILIMLAPIYILLPYIVAVIFPQAIPDRYMPYAVFFGSIPAVYSLLWLSSLQKRKASPSYSGIAVLLITLLIFLMITTPKVNPTPPYSKELASRQGLTYSEWSAAHFVRTNCPTDLISANSKYLSFIDRNISNYYHFINPQDNKTYLNKILVIREYDMKKGFTIPLFGSRALLEIVPANERFYAFLMNSSIIYQNGNVKVYYNH